jgi:hypothetical protein
MNHKNSTILMSRLLNLSKQMTTQLEIWTPEMAKQVLDSQNSQNRKINANHSKSLASDMSNNRFAVTHESIAFDETGILLDGQHRLLAVTLANTSVILNVTRGVPRSHFVNGEPLPTFESINCGKIRSIAMTLQMSGVKNATKVASCSRVIALTAASLSYDKKLTNYQIHEISEIIGESLHTVISLFPKGTLLRPTSPVLAAITLYHIVYPCPALEFAKLLMTISGVQDCPSRVLATWITNHSTSGGDKTIPFFGAAANALRFFHENKPCGKLFSTDAAIDWIHGLNPHLRRTICEVVK